MRYIMQNLRIKLKPIKNKKLNTDLKKGMFNTLILEKERLVNINGNKYVAMLLQEEKVVW
jgi:hypothetical protein